MHEKDISALGNTSACISGQFVTIILLRVNCALRYMYFAALQVLLRAEGFGLIFSGPFVN